MATLVYVDETGSKGRGARKQPQLILVAALVQEEQVQALTKALDRVAMKHLGWIPADFEFHGSEIWAGDGYWAAKQPSELLAAYEAAIAVLAELDIGLAHASINKAELHAKYEGAADENAYRLALQFLLEKIDMLGTTRKIVIADEAKADQYKAISMFSDMQDWGGGEVPGQTLRTVIDSLHFVRSQDSPGVQIADLVAYLIQRSRRGSEPHLDAQAARDRMIAAINGRTVTRREAWPN